MTSLTFYGGVNEIGGNKILLEDRDTKIFLDFGMSFNKRGKFFEEYLTPRTANGIGDFLTMGLIPDICGIYRSDLLKHHSRKTEEAQIDAVLLSHAHADHANYISFLHEDIPIYCGETAKLILEAIEEQSSRDIENEVLNFKKRPLHKCDYRKPPHERKFKTYRTGDRIKIGNLEIEPIHVDHSIPGAYGFIIHTSEGTIIYTGDLRLHGTRPQMTADFMEKAEDSEPVAMITEGTRINVDKDDTTEQTVHRTAENITKKAEKIVIADFNFKDVDRFRTFHRIAEKLGRTMTISFKHACYLEKYSEDKRLNVPDPKDDAIAILKPKTGTGTYDDEDYTSCKYIKDRLDYSNIITAEDIREKEAKYMVVLNFWYLNTLIDLRPKGGDYIHSLSEPFNEEMEISFERMKNWLDYFNLRFHQIHCSGHAPAADLRKIIDEIKPKTLYPVHTEHPEIFSRMYSNAITVKESESYEL